ncbi:MAG: hypothetical protein KDB74_06775 [Flavobacteriales bacterium]|nr:hypothetical protein [Flavobacteriales bacterium]
MKNVIKMGAIMVALIIGLASCEKEDNVSPLNLANSETVVVKKDRTQSYKSEESYLAEMAQAANISEISYEGGQYVITFHNSNDEYTVDVVDFDMESSIEYLITYNSTTTEVLIDFTAETVSIEDLDDYDFEEYATFNVTSNENVLRNVVSVITGHHAFEAEASVTYSDNGSSDVAPTIDPDTDARRKFIGTVHHPCIYGWTRGTSKYFFWIRVGGNKPGGC